MGAGSSTLNKSVKNVFSAELTGLNEVINKVLTPDGKFVNPNYNFLFEDVCSKYTVLWEKELNKHLKVDLENLAGSIYLVPKKDLIVSDDKQIEVTKQDLCTKISKHYIKILYILTLIKTVYDLENDGDNSIAGITQRNIRIVDNIMELNFCSIPHKDYDLQSADKINFEHLEGLGMFVDHFLTPVEKYAFLEQFKGVFARKPRQKVIDAICHDALVPLDEYNKVYKRKFNKDIVCDTPQRTLSKRTKQIDLMFDVAAFNPILHSHFCFSHKKLVIPLNRTDADTKTLKKLNEEMYEHYVQNVERILGIVDKLVTKTNDNYELKNISNEELENIVKDVKRTIMIFYIQAIVDFHVILDFAKDMPSIDVSSK